MRVENFDLKWAMRNGERRYPKLPWYLEQAKAPFRVPRRVNIEIIYFDPGEYIHPLTGEPMDLVARFTQKIRLSSWNSWRPMERISVYRLIAIRKDENQRWSPRKSKANNWKIDPIEQFNYSPIGRSRDFWYPTAWDFHFPDGSIFTYTRAPLSDNPCFLSLSFRRDCHNPTDSDYLRLPPMLNTSRQIVDFRPRPPQPRISYQF